MAWLPNWFTRDERERQLDTIIAGYYRAVEAGDCVDQKDFIAQHPEVQQKLNEFFPDIRVFARKERRDYLNHALEPSIVIASGKAE